MNNDDIRPLLLLTDNEIQILKYCFGYTNEMWAASIASIILRCDFRDANDLEIRAALKNNGEVI